MLKVIYNKYIYFAIEYSSIIRCTTDQIAISRFTIILYQTGETEWRRSKFFFYIFSDYKNLFEYNVKFTKSKCMKNNVSYIMIFLNLYS